MGLSRELDRCLDKVFGESDIHSIINERPSFIIILHMKGLVTGIK